jgi:hypothetical protein
MTAGAGDMFQRDNSSGMDEDTSSDRDSTQYAISE